MCPHEQVWFRFRGFLMEDNWLLRACLHRLYHEEAAARYVQQMRYTDVLRGSHATFFVFEARIPAAKPAPPRSTDIQGLK